MEEEERNSRLMIKCNELCNYIFGLCCLTVVQMFSNVVIANEFHSVTGEFYRLCGEDLPLGLQSLCGSRYAGTREKKDTAGDSKKTFMKYLIRKRQTNGGIVETCCYSQFGCSIDILSDFCEDGSIYKDTFVITHGHLRVVVVERPTHRPTISYTPAIVPVTPTRPSITRLRGRPRHRDRARSHMIRPYISVTRRPHDFSRTFNNLHRLDGHRYK
ncbi:uncharacterized protein LOC133185133 [Saccostrea echinata]|uniref:uncharacterized protein LOC133185133 n=1 Tax=Saccostrea echinata TaxID=191078 RepID=UPI002A8080CF|nr:uncharacterized protein LOC133185133 [Saccostrea echinata]